MNLLGIIWEPGLFYNARFLVDTLFVWHLAGYQCRKDTVWAQCARTLLHGVWGTGICCENRFDMGENIARSFMELEIHAWLFLGFGNDHCFRNWKLFRVSFFALVSSLEPVRLELECLPWLLFNHWCQTRDRLCLQLHVFPRFFLPLAPLPRPVFSLELDFLRQFSLVLAPGQRYALVGTEISPPLCCLLLAPGPRPVWFATWFFPRVFNHWRQTRDHFLGELDVPRFSLPLVPG